MTGDVYGIELIIPPEKTIAEAYAMREALLGDEDFSSWISEEDIYDDGMHLTVEYHDVARKSMVTLAERLGFIVDWDTMAEWEPYASEFEGEDE